MKKNDTLSLIVYVVILAIALAVGITMVRPLALDPAVEESLGGLSPVVVIVLAVVVGIILAAGLIELGHLLGAKIGKYEVLSFVVLGLGVKKNKDGKWKFHVGGFDGLTGGTAVAPKDREKSSLRAYIYLPLLFLVLLIVAMCLCMAFSGPQEAPETPWLYLSSLIVLTIAGMVLLYDIFPAALDSTNDGYRLVLVSNPKNKIAYNDLLLSEKCALFGEPMPEIEPYRDLTDFTASINSVLLYDALKAKDVDKALSICDIAIESKKGVSAAVYGDAVAMKLSLLLLYKDLSEGKKYFETLKSEEKKYIASMPSMAAVRAYLLISALIEESESESEVAIARHVTLAKKLPEKTKETEEALYVGSLEKAQALHPDWNVFSPAPEAAVEEPGTEREDVIRDAEENSKEDQ